MLILFGTRRTPSTLGQLPYVCARCQQNAWHHYVRSSQWFTLFFIPVIPLGSTTYATCGTCGFRQVVQNDHADRMFAQQRQMNPPHMGPR